MILTCPSCMTKYRLASEKLGEEGRKVRCGDCAFEWFQPPERPEDDDIDDHLVEEDVDGEEEEIEIDLGVADELPEGVVEGEFDNFRRAEQPKPPKKGGAVMGRIAASLLFVGVMAGLWVYKGTITHIWPQTYAVYSALGVETKTLGIDDISFERFQVMQDGAELHINGMIYNLKSEKVELPPLVVTLKSSSEESIGDMVFALETPVIEKEGTLQVEKTLKLEDNVPVRLIELRPATPQEYGKFMKGD